MSLQLERALEAMTDAGVVFYPHPGGCGLASFVRLRFGYGQIDSFIYARYKMVEAEFIRWIDAGLPGFARCFECNRNSDCDGANCKYGWGIK